MFTRKYKNYSCFYLFVSDPTIQTCTDGSDKLASLNVASTSYVAPFEESNNDVLVSTLSSIIDDTPLIEQNDLLVFEGNELTTTPASFLSDHTYSASKSPPLKSFSSEIIDKNSNSSGAIKKCKRKLLESSSSDDSEPDDPDEYRPQLLTEENDNDKNNEIQLAERISSSENIVDTDNNVNSPVINQNTDPERPAKLRNKNNKDKWRKILNKKKREQGEEYIGYRRAEGGKIVQDVQNEAKSMGPRCTSRLCQISKLRACPDITEEDRKGLFKNFWKVLTWDQRKMYVINLVNKRPIKRKRTAAESSRRNETLDYNLVIKGNKVQVCRQTFLNTFGLKKWSVRYWLYGDDKTPAKEELSDINIVPPSKITRRNQTGKMRKTEHHEYLLHFLDTLPKLPSHYCRSTTTRLYLERFTSKTELFEFYQEECTQNNKQSLSRHTFDQVLEKKNLGIFQPKKDQCDLCHSYEVGSNTVTEAEYNNHILDKNRARDEKRKDSEKAEQNIAHVFSQDTQAVKLAPCVNASAMYYKTKLCVHNFTMYNHKTHDAMTYWWDETESDLSASSFASCVVHNIRQTLNEDFKPIILWSDGCGYQNRSTIMSNALSHLAKERNVIIEQKFLVKGHTMMECDSVHSTIDTMLNPKRSTKNKKTSREIYLPSQYAELTKQARKKPFPYRSIYLDHTFFVDFSKKNTIAYESIRPGKKIGDPTVHDLRALRYNPDGTVEWKINFEDGYKPLPRRRREVSTEFLPLHGSRLKIKKSKWDHLQALKSHIPVDCHPYYDNIPYYNE